MAVGRLLSYWEANFSGAMLNFGRVLVSSVWRSKKLRYRSRRRFSLELVQQLPEKKKAQFQEGRKGFGFFTLDSNHTVDGRNPTPPGKYKTL